jgi:taurine dioxygenase
MSAVPVTSAANAAKPSADRAGISYDPICPSFGVEVAGVDMSKPLTAVQKESISDALVKHKVLVFRDQLSLTPKTNVEFGRAFGELEIEPFRDTVDGLPIFLSNGYGAERWLESWHIDLICQEKPPMACILRAVQIPDVGRDTAWADMEAVYDDLSDTMKGMLAGLKAYHSSSNVYGDTAKTGRSRPHESEKSNRVMEAVHPLVRTHPVSGRKSIYVNKVFTKHIVGMTARESTMLLNFLYEQVKDPEYQLRVRWHPGTVVMWDNRSTQHRLIIDRSPNEGRILHRVTICGDAPR